MAQTLDTVIEPEVRLQDQLTAVRNLRPGTPMREQESVLAQRVFREVLNLPESVDVLRWLQVERAEVTALLALRLSLDRAGRMYGMQNRLTDSGPMLAPDLVQQVREAVQDKYGPLLGGLLRSEGKRVASEHGRGPTNDSSERHDLVDSFAWLRRKSGLPVEASPNRSMVDPGLPALTADLLRLPDSTDPVQWIQDHGLSLSSRLVLEHLIQGVFPAENRLTFGTGGSPLGFIRPRIRTQLHGRLHVKVERIDILELGFEVHMKARFRLPKG